MATNKGRAPDARVYVVTDTGRADDDGRAVEQWTEVAAAWKTERGGFSFTLAVVPVELLAGRPARFVIALRSSSSEERPRDNRNQGGRR